MFQFLCLAFGVALAEDVGATAAVSAAVRPGTVCPQFRCVPPPCPAGDYLDPQTDSNGCDACPICKPCTRLFCPAIVCPKDKQKIVNQTNGCPGCPVCDCPKLFCPPLTACPATQTQTNAAAEVNTDGCPRCPTCQKAACKCGASCSMSSGSSGVCQVDGTCAVNIIAPKCPKAASCGACGSSCTTAKGKAGFCQSTGKCAFTKGACVPTPVCLFKCPNLACPADQQVPATGRCGCPTCKCPPINCPNINCPLAQQIKPVGCGCPTCKSCPIIHCPNIACTADQQIPSADGCGCPTCRTCPPIACPDIACPIDLQIKPTSSDGCGCPTCKPCPAIACANLNCPLDQQVKPIGGCGCPTCKIKVPILPLPVATAPPFQHILDGQVTAQATLGTAAVGVAGQAALG